MRILKEFQGKIAIFPLVNLSSFAFVVLFNPTQKKYHIPVTKSACPFVVNQHSQETLAALSLCGF